MAITVSPTSISFSGLVGGAYPAPQNIQITTSNGNPWSSADTSPWFNAPPTSGASGTFSSIIPHTDGLVAGVYTQNITFSATGLAAVVVVVTLTLTEPQPANYNTHVVTATATNSSGLSSSANITLYSVDAVGPSFASNLGALLSPMVDNGDGTISQSVASSDPTTAGRSVYYVDLPTSTTYTISASVNCPNSSSNSFFVQVGAEPTTSNAWIIPITSGLETRTVTWSPSSTPQTFVLSAGVHPLYIRGRAANAKLGTITFHGPTATLSSVLVSGPTVGTTAQNLNYVALAQYSDGTSVDVTLSATWDSSNHSAATVTSPGLMLAVAAGTSNISATYNAVTSNAIALVVTDPPPSTPPGTPSNPIPANASIDIGLTPSLAWTSTGAATYAVNFGTVNPPPQVTTGITNSGYVPGALVESTIYYWKIIATNSDGSTSGPVWTFSTMTTPPPPPPPPDPSIIPSIISVT